MSDISAPQGLVQAGAILNLVTQFQKLNDASERKKIADEIATYHSLNETESRKAAEARELIKKHSDILQETRRSEERIISERKLLNQDRTAFRIETETSNLRLSEKEAKLKEMERDTRDFHNRVVESHARIDARESELKQQKDTHSLNVKKHEEDKVALEKHRLEIERFRNEVLSLDKQTNEKIERLKQFNF